MLTDKWIVVGIDILRALFTLYIFFCFFSIFFVKKKRGVQTIVGILILVIWQIDILGIICMIPIGWNIVMSVGVTLFVVANMFEGKFTEKCFFSIIFDALWMLIETMVGNLLMIYCEAIADSRIIGSCVSKVVFFVVVIALKKVFTKEEVREFPSGRAIGLVFIPAGSIYIMNAVFVLADETKKEYAELYSLVSVVILLLVNILAGYIYIKLADDQQIRRKNIVYEQQLELCERHQEETELAMLQMRDVKHNMRNNLISLLAYAEQGECQKMIGFINDVMKEGRLKTSKDATTGNIVIDSLVEYWKRTAEKETIDFQAELSIPMEMSFKGADISLILGNLLENAVEGAEKAIKKKYIKLSVKYDRKNLLINIENSYGGKLKRVKEELRTTKENAANHGIGLASVRRAARKYQGTVFIDDTVPECFLVRVVLYGS
ncbi:MAG: sensor histidine kinase [Mediterraneibacter gnavus]|jgi:two-component system sensor histidine kinase AgrC